MGRRIWYSCLALISHVILRLLWATCRLERVVGAEHMERARESGAPVIPCYWHQMHVYCSRYMLDQIHQGMKVGFLISPSVSGELPAQLARRWQASVVRGSPTRTGGQALRDLYLTVSRDRISPVITVDGPKGPAEVVKIGAVLLARLTRTPMIPMAYAASSAWKLKTWDRFMIPRPFSRIVLAIGAPLSVPASTPIEDLEPMRQTLEKSLKTVAAQAREEVGKE